jgi:hypothetical protein
VATIGLGDIVGVEVAFERVEASLWVGWGWQPMVNKPIKKLKVNKHHLRSVMHTQLSNEINLFLKIEVVKSDPPVRPGS